MRSYLHEDWGVVVLGFSIIVLTIPEYSCEKRTTGNQCMRSS